jgi:WS/DGAT/MGAT family acyltransferase
MAPPFTAPVTAFNAPFTDRRNIAFTQLELADVKTVKNRFGLTVNDVVTTLCSGALRQFLADRGELPDAPLVATIPMSVRDRSDRPGRNQTMWMFCRLATDIADPGQRLSAVAERNAVAKDHGSAMPPALLQDWAELAGQTVLNVTVQIARKLPLHGRPVHNLVLSNVPGPQETLSFLGCEVEALLPFGPIVMGAGLNITVMSVGGKLGVGIISCPDLIEDVWELADAFPTAMKELLDLAP